MQRRRNNQVARFPERDKRRKELEQRKKERSDKHGKKKVPERKAEGTAKGDV